MRSLTTCATSSPRSRPTRGCCRLAEVSALFHSAGSVAPARPRRARAPPRPRELGRRAPRVHAPARARRPLRDPHLPPARLRPRDPLPAARRPATRRARPRSSRRACSTPRHAPLERPPKRVVGRACCRGAYLRGALLGAGSLSGPRSPHLELRTTSLDGASSCARSPRPRDVRLGVLDRGRHAVAYAKGREAIEAVLARGGRERDRARARGARRRRSRARRGEPPRERRPRQPRPHEPRRAGAARSDPRAATRRARSSGCRPAARDRRLRLRHPTLPLRELAAKCGPPTTKAAVHRRLTMLKDSRVRTLSIGRRSEPFSESWREAGSAARRWRFRFRPRSMQAGRRGSSEDDLPLRRQLRTGADGV